MNKIQFFIIFLILNILQSSEVPDSFDWRDEVTIPQKIREYTSWLDIVTGMLEILYTIRIGKSESFSEQMLLDCISQTSDFIGDQIPTALKWIIKNGIEKSIDYPYIGRRSTCKLDTSKYISNMKVYNYIELGPNADEDEMRDLLYNNGPFFIFLNIKPISPSARGIIDLDESTCPSTEANTPLLLVGYGSLNGKDYWIVYGPFGKSWGDNGYLKIARGKGVCGINQRGFIPLADFQN